MNPINSILIANRAEIAVRVITTCRSLGIRTVAIYSSHDKDLPHVFLADEAYALGSGSLHDTYLNHEKIIAIALKAKVSAVHPGYGFLSENSAFARKVVENGLIFIGPPAKCIESMGDKIESIALAKRAGVPTVPGYTGDDQSAETLLKEAQRIGYPVMIKASAGGGGKGMRIVERESDFLAALGQAQGEALNSFGDDRVLVEKYLVSPRHIEVQVLSDTHNNHLHLFERECSIQRRHQKIIEETPSPAITPELRAHVTSCAAALTREISYVNAGTVEFIMDQSGALYFLEMNTRLQVEHPVTEAITGLDLVKLQIEIAEGKPIPFQQEEIAGQGHALECRLYAEDPYKGHLPASGEIRSMGTLSTDGIMPLRNSRLDAGYVSGNSISPFYDPMIAKVITWGATRNEAIATMKEALSRLTIDGVKNNGRYLQRILAHPAFVEGKTTTSFLFEHEADLLAPPVETFEQALACAAYFLATGAVSVVGEVANPGSSTGAEEFTAWKRRVLSTR
jgi:3-methylcrotonyl-CoA carboxylase alpha subunit